MPAHIKEFVIVNNTGNIFTGDNLSDTSFTASKSYSGSMGCTWIDVVTVIGTETKLCLQPGDSVTTTYTRGTPAGTVTGTNMGQSVNTSGIAQAVPNTDNMDSLQDSLKELREFLLFKIKIVLEIIFVNRLRRGLFIMKRRFVGGESVKNRDNNRKQNSLSSNFRIPPELIGPTFPVPTGFTGIGLLVQPCKGPTSDQEDYNDGEMGPTPQGVQGIQGSVEIGATDQKDSRGHKD